ncbi:toxin [Streptomyces sp. 7N604]|uniref:toxin n=1 Tax=Streptomyces sp. 7N604 TaxID=3457415 RepID=UPI003FD65C34
MNDHKLRKHCAAIVEQLQIPDPFDINDLCDRLEETRGRAISLAPMPLPVGEGSPCGLWVATDDVDYILYQERTSRVHQVHIILHEIGHLLCRHEATPALHDEVSRLLMPTLDPELVRVVLGRTQYTSQEERAAELIASLISMRANAVTDRAVADVPPEVAHLVTHLERSLERSSTRRNNA